MLSPWLVLAACLYLILRTAIIMQAQWRNDARSSGVLFWLGVLVVITAALAALDALV